MKNFHLSRLYIVLLLSLSLFIPFSVAKAEDPLSYIKMVAELEWTYSFGYSESDRLTIRNVSDASIDVDSPIIKNEGNDITSYWFFATEDKWTTIPQINRCFDDVQIDWNKFSVSLETDWMSKSTVYYLYAVPINSSVKIGKNWSCSSSEAISWWKLSVVWRDSSVNNDDPCFKISWRVYWKWNECSSSSVVSSSSTVASSTASHTTAQTTSVYSIAWVSHTYTWNQITLTWNSFSDVDMVVYYENPSNWRFERLWTVNSDTKTYTFTAKHDWDYLIRFEPVDGTQPIHYTAHYVKTETPQVTPTVKPPVVWPKENILLVVFGTLILYVIYSVVRRKAS